MSAQPKLENKVIIAHAKPFEINQSWDMCQKFFNVDGMYKYQQFSPAEIKAHLDDGSAYLFVAIIDGEIVGACVTTIEETRTGGKSLFVPIMGGVRFNEWYKDLADFVEVVAKENNCKTIEYIGRKGFSRLDDSYVEDGRIYVKEIK
jgi:hypothetical protein